jgi:hypothetical protein
LPEIYPLENFTIYGTLARTFLQALPQFYLHPLPLVYMEFLPQTLLGILPQIWRFFRIVAVVATSIAANLCKYCHEFCNVAATILPLFSRIFAALFHVVTATSMIISHFSLFQAN